MFNDGTYFSFLEIERAEIRVASVGRIEDDTVRFTGLEVDRKIGFLAVSSGQSVVFVTAEFHITEPSATALRYLSVV